jgi:RNA polymerase sigma-70 factor (ECF subfamily)
MIQRGIQLLARSADGRSVSPYHLEAAIAACHSTAVTAADTDWPRILSLYDQLIRQTSSPIVAMNRAVAVARVHGPRAGQDALTRIGNPDAVASLHLYHAIHGSLAAELGDFGTALMHYQTAHGLAQLPAEREFIDRRLSEYERKLRAAGRT